MRILQLDKKNISQETAKEISSALKKGEVVLMPTDTVYSLHCLATNEKAVDKIRRIKMRPKEKAMVVIIKSYCMLHDYAKTSKKQEKYIRTIWPPTTRQAHDKNYQYRERPTTFIFESKNNLANSVINNDGSVALRLPKDEFLIKILKQVNLPLVSTSANISGKYPITRLTDLKDIFAKTKPDLIVDAGALTKRTPSRIIDIRNIEDINIIRK